MLKKTIKYHDLDGKPIEEDFYFNFTKGELVEMQFYGKDGLTAHLTKIMESGDQGEIIKSFRDIIKASLGRRVDNVRFEKSEQIWLEFSQSEAYSELIVELLSNANSCADFIKGVVPAEISGRVDVNEAINKMKVVDIAVGPNGPGEILSVTPVEEKPMAPGSVTEKLPDGTTGGRPKTLREYTDAELMEMDYNQFVRMLNAEKGNVPQNALIVAMNRMNDGK